MLKLQRKAPGCANDILTNSWGGQRGQDIRKEEKEKQRLLPSWGKKAEYDVKALIHLLNKYLLSNYYVRSIGRDTKGAVVVALQELTLELEELSRVRRWWSPEQEGAQAGRHRTGSLCSPVQKVREKLPDTH